MTTEAIRYLAAALVVAVVAAGLAHGARVERRVAAAERALSAMDLNGAARQLEAERAGLAGTGWLPWIFEDTQQTVEARLAEARFWRGEYAALIGEYPDLGAEAVRTNRALQLVVATAHARASLAAAGDDRTQVINGLDRAIAAYRQILLNTNGDREAAYDFEVLVRLRRALADGADVPDTPLRGPLGTQGGSGEDDMDMLGDMNEIQIYVPSDMLGRESTDEPTVGSDAPIRRRG